MNPSYKIGTDDLLFNLVFFSTFEELDLPIHGLMEGAAVLKLYEPSPTPCLCVAPIDHVLGRVPLFPLFLAGTVHTGAYQFACSSLRSGVQDSRCYYPITSRARM